MGESFPYINGNFNLKTKFFNEKKIRMRAYLLNLFLPLFMLKKTLAMNYFMDTNYWMRRFHDHIILKNGLKARLRELSILELQNLIERVSAFELKKKLEKERETRLREEERISKERDEEMIVAKIKLFIESRFGTSSFLKDFTTNLMM
jgi:hypothetical protein